MLIINNYTFAELCIDKNYHFLINIHVFNKLIIIIKLIIINIFRFALFSLLYKVVMSSCQPVLIVLVLEYGKLLARSWVWRWGDIFCHFWTLSWFCFERIPSWLQQYHGEDFLLSYTYSIYICPCDGINLFYRLTIYSTTVMTTDYVQSITLNDFHPMNGLTPHCTACIVHVAVGLVHLLTWRPRSSSRS